MISPHISWYHLATFSFFLCKPLADMASSSLRLFSPAVTIVRVGEGLIASSPPSSDKDKK